MTRAGERVDLSRPVARPAPVLDRVNASVRVEVRPLGSVPFDALTLPLVAIAPSTDAAEPDLWIASQHGATPPWPVVLADGTPESRRVPGNIRISAFRVERKGGKLRAVEWERPLQGGLLLGRSADESGFLVEWPRGDGSRWIGRVEWASGRVEWLVGGEGALAGEAEGVAAFASKGPGGELAFSRRAASGAWELVVRKVGAAGERTLASPVGDSLVFPTFSADRSRVYVIAVPRAGMGLPRMLAVDLGAEGDGKELRVGAFATLNFEASVGAAWQSVTCLTTPWSSDVQGALATGAAFLSLETGSMAWIDGATGAVRPLARGTVGASAACGADRGEGLMLGAAGELVFQPVKRTGGEGGAEFGAETAVVRGAFVPRVRWRGSQSTCGVVVVSPAVGGTSEEVGVFEILGGRGE